MFYVIMLVLGLFFIYTLRDALLILQERRDRREMMEEKLGRSCTNYIIIQNNENCKRAG